MPVLSFRWLPALLCGSLKAAATVLLVAVDDAAARQIVGRKFHRYFVARQDPNKIFAHLAGDVRQHLMLVFQLHAKHGIGQRLDHRSHDFDGVLLGGAGVAFLFLVAELLRHSLLYCCSFARSKDRPLQRPDTYQHGPVTSLGPVRIHGPFPAPATLCSKGPDGLPSAASAPPSS